MSESWFTLPAEGSIEKSDAVNLLRKQASNMAKDSNGKIKATFSKIEYKNSVKETVEMISKMTSVCKEIDDENSNLSDIEKELYGFEKYKFEIFNEKYKFRVFTLENRIMFPIYINIDEDISEEIHLEKNNPIDSNCELESIVRNVFASSKMQAIFSEMLK